MSGLIDHSGALLPESGFSGEVGPRTLNFDQVASDCEAGGGILLPIWSRPACGGVPVELYDGGGEARGLPIPRDRKDFDWEVELHILCCNATDLEGGRNYRDLWQRLGA